MIWNNNKKSIFMVNKSNFFRFGSVFIKKNNQTEIFFKKKPKPVQTDRFRFGSVFRTKTGFSGLVRFWLGFFGLVFSVLGL
jgi:hypothetical protein